MSRWLKRRPRNEIFLVAQAEITFAARRGVERHDAIAGREIRDALAGFDNGPCHFVPEERRRHDHARVIAAAEDLQVRSAGKRRADLDDQFAHCCLGNGNLLDAYIFTAVENGGLHGAAPVNQRVLDSSAAQADGGFDRSATFNNYRLDGIQTDFDDRLDGIQASLDHILDGVQASFDDGFDRFAATADRVFHGIGHRTL